MKWKLPFTGKSKIERRIESIEGQIGDEKKPSIRESWMFSAFYGFDIKAVTILLRLDSIEEKVSQIVKYLDIESKTVEEHTFYRKKGKKTK